MRTLLSIVCLLALCGCSDESTFTNQEYRNSNKSATYTKKLGTVMGYDYRIATIEGRPYLAINNGPYGRETFVGPIDVPQAAVAAQPRQEDAAK